MSGPAEMLAIARWLVHERGFSVIPLDHPAETTQTDPRRIGKVPAVPSWKAFQTAHPTDDDLLAWFGNGRRRNVAIVTGAVSGLVMVDCDSPEAIAWADANLPRTPLATRTAKGEHRGYRHPGVPVRNKARIRTRDPAVKIDIRGDGGFVVAPGSLHQTGVMYERIGDWPPIDELPVFNPAWLDPEKPDASVGETSQVRRERERADREDDEHLQRRARAYVAKVPPAIEGQGGDEHTFQLACKVLRGFDLSDADALELLRDWNQRCVPPWTEAQLLEKIEGARKYGTEPIGGRIDEPRHATIGAAAQSRTVVASVNSNGRASKEDASDHLSDTGNAARFVRLYRGRLLYCYPMGTWFVYDGRVWQPDTTGHVMRFAKAAVATFYQEAAGHVTDDKQRKLIAA